MRDLEVGYKMCHFYRTIPRRIGGNSAGRSQTCGGFSQRSNQTSFCLCTSVKALCPVSFL